MTHTIGLSNDGVGSSIGGLQERMNQVTLKLHQLAESLREKWSGDKQEQAWDAVIADEQRAILESELVEIEKQLALNLRRGSKNVIVKSLPTGDVLSFTVTDNVVLSPSNSKCISYDSPLGSALANCTPGQVVRITVPSGVKDYLIERVET